MDPNDLDEQFKRMKEIMDEIAKKQMQSPWMFPSTARNTSPSATDSHYPYQEPERDEQGTFYGYKILYWMDEGVFRSPRYPTYWSGGELTSDVRPAQNHMHGIHFAKRPDHPNLREYELNEWSTDWSSNRNTISLLVKCALSGTVVETDQGFRAQHAQVIGVLLDGYWKSYQDLERYSAAHSRRDSLKEDYRRWYYDDWSNPR